VVDPMIFAAFVPAALALNLTPGADMMFCLGQGMRSGARGAWAASAGISSGSMVHVMLAGVGLGAVVAAAPLAFDVIRWAGVAYLMWLAWQSIRAADVPRPEPLLARHAFRQGLVVNLTNPKVILFVLAFVPQFVRPDAGPVLVQFLIFGGVIALGGFVINGLVGVFAGTFGAGLTRHARVLGWLTGGIFAVLAVRLAVMQRA
jgi:threonine/homoserine/homoserine lactone efflux protein